MTGLSLAHYRIDAELGRGGMGIVYKATDTKLNRTVALKVLPASALASEDDRARFFREAQSAAQLQHPHIATVYQIDEAVPAREGKEPQPGAEPRLFIAMEFVDGETLADRISKAPLPLAEVVSLTTQIAEALRAAHGKDIVHRDIKSANVMITLDGVAKVLDFGLAKTNQSTMLTRMGSTVGTVAYMSPEQARGQEVDLRTDLYSLGAMMYEMVCGRLPFKGDYEQAVMYGILNENPEPLTALRTGVPMSLEFVVNKLLAKEADYRYQSAAGLLADLKSLDLTGSGHSRRSAASLSVASAAGPVAIPRSSWTSPRTLLVAAVCLMLGVALGAALLGSNDEEPTPNLLRRVEISLPGMENIKFPTLSPDGKYLAFRAVDAQGRAGIYLRDLATGETRYMDSTEDGGNWEFGFSPSGDRIAFTEGVNGGLFTVVVPSGIPQRRTEFGRYAYWEDDKTLVVNDDRSGGGGVYRLDLDTNEMTSVSMDSTASGAGYGNIVKTHVAGSGRAFGHELIRLQTQGITGDHHLFTVDLEDGHPDRIESFAINPEFVAGGFLTYQLRDDAGKLVVRPIDVETGQFVGQPLDVLPEGVGTAWSRYALSRDGDLLFVEGVAQINLDLNPKLFLVDLDTRSTLEIDTVLPDNTSPSQPALSGDGSRIAFHSAGVGQGRAIYVYDLREQLQSQVTFEDRAFRPVFGPQDERLFFDIQTDSSRAIGSLGTDDAQGTAPRIEWPGGRGVAISHDNRWMAIETEDSSLELIERQAGVSVWSDSTGRFAFNASFSRDNLWVAYNVAAGDDQLRIVVRSVLGSARFELPGMDGLGPAWSGDNDYLYFRMPAGIYRLPVRTKPNFSILGEPQLVFPLTSDRGWDISADGRTLVVSSPSLDERGADSVAPRVIWYQNWSDHLKREFGR